MRDNNKQYEIIISTCDKFADLWDAAVYLYSHNWKNRSTKTYLVTDNPTEKTYKDIVVFSAGEGTEMTERIASVLKNIEAKYVLLTLDDYFLSKPISNKKLDRVIQYMEEENVDYVQMYPHPIRFLKREKAIESSKHSGFYLRDVSVGDYKVVLTPGMWRKDFLENTVSSVMNAWQYEVSLTNKAYQYGAKCAVSNNNEFPYLDVIRKGKVLRKANRYFKVHPIYKSKREVMKLKDEWILGFRTFLRMWMPRPVFIFIKKLMVKLGFEFYSPIDT